MAKTCHNNVFDKGWEWVRDNVTHQVLCSDPPTTFTEATVTYALADVALTSGSAGDITIADGTVSGRKITVAAKTNVDVDAPGDGDHVALVDSNASVLMYVTSLTTPKTGLEVGDKVNFPEWKAELRDPQ